MDKLADSLLAEQQDEDGERIIPKPRLPIRKPAPKCRKSNLKLATVHSDDDDDDYTAPVEESDAKMPDLMELSDDELDNKEVGSIIS